MKYFARFSREKKEWTIYKEETFFLFPVGQTVHERFSIEEDSRFEYFEKYIKPELVRLNYE